LVRPNPSLELGCGSLSFLWPIRFGSSFILTIVFALPLGRRNNSFLSLYLITFPFGPLMAPHFFPPCRTSLLQFVPFDFSSSLSEFARPCQARLSGFFRSNSTPFERLGFLLVFFSLRFFSPYLSCWCSSWRPNAY